MSETTTTMEVRSAGGAAILDISGDVTAASEDVLMAAYERAGDGPRAVILNFSGLEYMNSGGIGLLVTLLVRANRQRRKLVAYGLSEHYRQIFELTRLDEAIDIRGDERDALAAAGAA
jgi:anti-sigma B factor antagonist